MVNIAFYTELKGLLAIAKLKPLSLFISILSMLKKALDNVKIEKKSESGFSFAIASQPFRNIWLCYGVIAGPFPSLYSARPWCWSFHIQTTACNVSCCSWCKESSAKAHISPYYQYQRQCTFSCWWTFQHRECLFWPNLAILS